MPRLLEKVVRKSIPRPVIIYIMDYKKKKNNEKTKKQKRGRAPFASARGSIRSLQIFLSVRVWQQMSHMS